MVKKGMIQNIKLMNFSKSSMLETTILQLIKMIRNFTLIEMTQISDPLLEFLSIRKLEYEFKSELKNN